MEALPSFTSSRSAKTLTPVKLTKLVLRWFSKLADKPHSRHRAAHILTIHANPTLHQGFARER
jgi:hypothetical protein